MRREGGECSALRGWRTNGEGGWPPPDGFLVRQWEGREWKGGGREGATSVHFSISLSPFGFDRSVSFPSSLSRPSVLCSH